MYSGSYLRKALLSGVYLSKRLYVASKNALRDLIDNCGLIAYNTNETDGILYDEVGYESRPAKQALQAIGDSVSYIELTGFENEPLSYIDAATGLTVNTNWSASAQFLIPTNGIAFLTTTKAGITYYLDPTFRQTNGKYPLTTGTGNEAIYAQQEFSPAIPTQVILTRESLPGSQGYTVADGSQTEDIAGLIPYAIGEIIPNFLNSNISIAYVDGVHPTAQYSKRVKYDRRVVDGVVDNGVDYKNWDNIDTANTIDISSDGLKFTGDGNTQRARLPLELKLSTDYMLVVDINQNDNLVAGGFRIMSGGDYSSVITPLPTGITGEYRVLFTSVSVEPTFKRLACEIRSTATIGGVVDIRNYRVYEVANLQNPSDPLNSPLPTSGSFESGNSIIWADLYNGIFITDLNDITTDHLAGTNKILAYDDMANITLQQQWVSEDKQQIGWTSEPIERHSECDSKFRKFLSMNEQFYVQTFEGSGIYEPYLVDDGTGTFIPFMVLKNWVEVIE